ncbi:hypothetical protein T265_12374 [Opisthorchis viverrini]|uniref:Uncharacterized protein n=1 Tax=Opisthorchis viverrini TaxID=6198 RepID=A0A074YY44_OPIVI|nr:hypothetical protein T265_12374 [Opisthorchis viverrini]KER18107.1 hypothetical protein T265_12374 [Opisthorchis viverrini]
MAIDTCALTHSCSELQNGCDFVCYVVDVLVPHWQRRTRVQRAKTMVNMFYRLQECCNLLECSNNGNLSGCSGQLTPPKLPALSVVETYLGTKL